MYMLRRVLKEYGANLGEREHFWGFRAGNSAKKIGSEEGLKGQ
jgi:hypothetical protein